MEEKQPMSYLELMDGAIAMGLLAIAAFFLRFWRDQNDRIFLGFSIAFAVLAIHKAAFGFSLFTVDSSKATLYVPRFFAYLLIILAILDRNLRNDRE